MDSFLVEGEELCLVHFLVNKRLLYWQKVASRYYMQRVIGQFCTLPCAISVLWQIFNNKSVVLALWIPHVFWYMKAGYKIHLLLFLHSCTTLLCGWTDIMHFYSYGYYQILCTFIHMDIIRYYALLFIWILSDIMHFYSYSYEYYQM